jgi:hypothetical protein
MLARFRNGEGCKFAHLFFAVCLLSVSASASSISYQGTLSSPETDAEFTFALKSAGVVTFQTWGFGGGTNASNQIVAPGGFDPLIALFSGLGPTATIVTDGLGDPFADADNLVNGPLIDPTLISYVGNCPPAGEVAIGVDNDCGDDLMQVSLSAGTYTLTLSDANYIPNALYDLGTLSEGYSDLTAGVFQTCDSTDGSCITPNGNYAVDIVSSGLAVAPEPSALSLLGIGLAALAGLKQLKNRRKAPNSIGGRSI